ncbi:2-oxoglutarate/2-oxoacid ferredoxin oxidoreductase subunit alpha [Candidatus Hakubella thermalkaliphila]|uniref:2-oxoglutarate/2-oxoacid ferredoxin oxidoreductase subunit alpha n=1 Tax=Candidatus Hakubella thermalkaliphila TaxID=2754717 RepID=A0A6V8QGD0_9ACTN|nr:hypothetical protein [Candidatus Hakubella thermalkaliphila]GFP20330.1 2-oxoglutarate/2-oxoacid ferredoxin oxidoreductase subunit alpha [Candidatus Hakubella thermalkaliphila]GFP29972.1 2-oxoglutarate/2-oxoacid ferredoxin oxidoreductase subunit alpha [Candidatus Hakubella thermalkaliphila]GFP37439.1 2-oxoglutarate/2-oxoacid ferredoxin oxidoreductase subunit alpha [Candidatus Hakubella thermalkaliphila]GFP39936.1 2-oxoglutarate/2-oxoacid ferredoxin oxidoreductase subunit alpha [Candidatus Hak
MEQELKITIGGEAGQGIETIGYSLLKKLEGLQREAEPLIIYGEENPDLLFLGWESTQGVLQEVVDILNSQDKRAGLVHPNQVWPLANNLYSLLASAKKVVAIENNATGQLCRLVAQETGTIIEQKILKYDGWPFTPEYILERL